MFDVRQVRDGLVYVDTPIGAFQVYRFYGDHPNGRPWHLTTTGRFFASVEDAVAHLKSIDYSEDDDAGGRPVCHGEMTHSFLATEASLDACPY